MWRCGPRAGKVGKVGEVGEETVMCVCGVVKHAPERKCEGGSKGGRSNEVGVVAHAKRWPPLESPHWWVHHHQKKKFSIVRGVSDIGKLWEVHLEFAYVLCEVRSVLM